MTIGERIREARKKYDFTQKSLAIKSGVSETAIRKYENHTRSPRVEQLEKLASALNISVGWLLSGDQDEDKMLQHIIDTLPNAEVIETDKKISIPIVSMGDDRPLREVVRERVIRWYDELNDEGQKRAFLYIDQLRTTHPRESEPRSEE